MLSSDISQWYMTFQKKILLSTVTKGYIPDGVESCLFALNLHQQYHYLNYSPPSQIRIDRTDANYATKARVIPFIVMNYDRNIWFMHPPTLFTMHTSDYCV